MQLILTFLFYFSDTEKDLQKAKDVAKLRLQLIERKNKDVYRAILWLRENKDKFRHTIYEPMIIEVSFLMSNCLSCFNSKMLSVN